MTAFGWFQLGLYLLVLLLLVKPLGAYMARVYQGEHTFVEHVVGPAERFIYRLLRLFGTRVDEEMDWRTYAIALLLFSFAGFLLLYALQRLQHLLPLNPADLTATSPHLAFNTAVSFVTNTNWQSYGGETTLSYLTQMLGLTVPNFVSAAVGMAVLVAIVRAFARQSVNTIGNFWADLTRGILYILLPLALVLALVLVSQGAVQTFRGYESVPLLQPTQDANGQTITEQVLALGPAASQIAIKQLGTNGGGFFNVNSSHPFENATPDLMADKPKKEQSAEYVAYELCGPGDVLVVDAMRLTYSSVGGDIKFFRLHQRQAEGLVTDGAIRDSNVIKGYGLRVFSSGTTAKQGPAEILPWGVNEVIQCGGVLVRPGDAIVGDDDGVVVVPRVIVDEVIQIAREREEVEGLIKREIERSNISPGRYYPFNEETQKLVERIKGRQ